MITPKSRTNRSVTKSASSSIRKKFARVSEIRIALAQINPVVGNLDQNAKTIRSIIHEAKSKGSDLILFPELALTGYPPEDLLLKKMFVYENLCALKGLADSARGIVAVVGYVDRDVNGLYNSAALLSNGKPISSYRKMELPNYGVFDEKRYFLPGRSTMRFLLNGLTFCVSICEDVWVDNSSVLTGSRDADILLNISSSPYHNGKENEREQLLKKRAKEAQAFVIYNNLVGGQDELVFDGSSLAVSPEGKILARGKAFKEDLVLLDIEAIPKRLKTRRKKSVQVKTFNIKKITPQIKPPLKKIKVSRLSMEASVFEALKLGVADYVRKNGFQKTVIGLSGGIDSALTTAIASEAIGPENVFGILMPSPWSSNHSVKDSLKLAKNLGIETFILPIEPAMKAYAGILSEEKLPLDTSAAHFPNRVRRKVSADRSMNYKKISKNFHEELKGSAEFVSGLAGENIQARIRGNLLMALSNRYNWLVLTTGNKSEISVGYCTLYGDMAGGFAVVKDVPKTLVYQLAQYINRKNRCETIPQCIIDKPPSAELRPGQKDTDSLPEYDLLDEILHEYIENDKPIRELKRKGFPEEEIQKVINLVDANEYKRRQAPPGIKITPKSFGKDRRLPITNKYGKVNSDF